METSLNYAIEHKRCILTINVFHYEWFSGANPREFLLVDASRCNPGIGECITALYKDVGKVSAELKDAKRGRDGTLQDLVCLCSVQTWMAAQNGAPTPTARGRGV